MALRKNKEYLIGNALDKDCEHFLQTEEDNFKAKAERHLPALLHAAREEIKYQRRLNRLDSDTIMPDELVGETLIEACRYHHCRPYRIGLKDWLIELQGRILARIIHEEMQFKQSLSTYTGLLSEPISDNDNDSFWEWQIERVAEYSKIRRT